MFIPQFVKQFIVMSDRTQEITVVKLFHWQILPPQGLTVYQFLIILVIGCSLANLVLWIISLRLSEYTISHIRHLIRMQLFKKIINLSKDNINELSHASIITYFGNDINKINGGFFVLCRSLLNGTFLIVWGLVFSLNLDLNLSIAIFINIPVVIIGSLFAIKFLFPSFRKENWILDKLNEKAKQDINGIELIKTYNLENYRYKLYNEENENLLKLNLKVTKTSSIAWPVIHTFVAFGNILVFLIFGFLAKNYTNANIQEKVGNLYQFLAYLGLISSGIFQVCFESNKLFRARFSAKRIYEVLQMESIIPEVTNDNKPTEWNIEFKNVSYRYKNNETQNALQNVSFKIPNSSSVGIIGTTGSGKSTIVNLLTKEILPTQGEILINNLNLNEIDSAHLRQNISAIWQKNMLLSGSIKENLVFTHENANDAEIDEVINIAQANFIKDYPDKYEQIIGQHGINLSGGQKQRISIAQGLIKKPNVLILDDSTSALDNKTDKNLQDQIKSKLKDTTLIIISQRIRTIQNLDQIIVLDQGQIVGNGSHQELLANNTYYQKLFESQKEK
ncbi:ABC-type multidrug/protein/lipid transport system ATPase component [Mycoplasmopsis glycophila]|uniref:ABC-type multidrug/protein/lipid transport system ATPase component n=2 Tax=Mycoplasmopsis glycophila TaxID=171285 RepID=A0A449AWF0_9BACT|nr:ABC-type multidrug/protein/lipid transport system ATPase component [Mycoplasmopsis glycophila]